MICVNFWTENLQIWEFVVSKLWLVNLLANYILWTIEFLSNIHIVIWWISNVSGAVEFFLGWCWITMRVKNIVELISEFVEFRYEYKCISLSWRGEKKESSFFQKRVPNKLKLHLGTWNPFQMVEFDIRISNFESWVWDTWEFQNPKFKFYNFFWKFIK